MRLSRKDRAKIANLSVHGLAKFKSEEGQRLHSKAIRQEIVRRVKQHVAGHPAIVRHKQKQASQTLR
jgi:hypothetical protein